MELSTSELSILECLLEQDIQEIRVKLHFNELTSMYNLKVVERKGLEAKLKNEKILLKKMRKKLEGVQ